MAASDRLTRRKRQFVAAMVGGCTVAAAAEVAGVSPRTGWRYAANSSVRAALSDALDQALAEATRRMVTAMSGALVTLVSIHEDLKAPTGSRVAAARTIVTSGPRFYEVLDLATRVAALEESLRE